MNKIYDIIIVGAGPSGIACAYQLKNMGYSIAVIEKHSFPRDKTCGDALSLDIVNQLKIMDPELWKRFESIAEKTPSYGIKIISPGGYTLNLPLYTNGEKNCGYVCKRKVFDNFLFEELYKTNQVDFYLNTNITDILFSSDFVEVKTEQFVFTSKIIIGADGAHSIVKSKTVGSIINKDHYSAGLRQYFTNVTNFNEGNFIELYFFKDLVPGYLWVFPLPNNEANVGIGLLSSFISKKSLNLKEIFQKQLREHPALKERFKDAVPLETIKGYGLPLGSSIKQISGNRFLLLGDAASLIDPFSGEGIANGIRSGRLAADVIKEAMTKNDFSAKFLKKYDRLVKHKMGLEFLRSKQLQTISKYTGLFDFAAKRFQTSLYLQNFLQDAFVNVHKRKFIVHPTFLYHLFLKGLFKKG